MPPKMGLLTYLREGYDPGGRDVVFVPVAINYDRILEDRVLIAAGKRGDRRFGARISVVIGFVLKKFWQGLRGRYVRFGTAAVVFGEPLSLRRFGPERPVEELAGSLMQRIEDAMPVLVVPLVAHVLRMPDAPSSEHDITAAAAELAQQVVPHMPEMTPEEFSGAVAHALQRLKRHRVLSDADGVWQPVLGEEAVLDFYAASIAHRFAEADAKN